MERLAYRIIEAFKLIASMEADRPEPGPEIEYRLETDVSGINIYSRFSINGDNMAFHFKVAYVDIVDAVHNPLTDYILVRETTLRAFNGGR